MIHRNLARIIGRFLPRHAAPAGLETEQAGERGRNADRAAAIIGMGNRHNAGRHCRRTAARRSAGGEIRIPRVAGGAVRQGLGHAHQAEFRRRRLAQRQSVHLGKGIDKPFIGGGRGCLLKRAAAVAGGPALVVVQILDEGRDHRLAVVRGQRTDRPRPVDQDGKVQLCLRRFGPLQSCQHRFARARVPTADAGSQANGIIGCSRCGARWHGSRRHGASQQMPAVDAEIGHGCAPRVLAGKVT